jgi:uncharacterized membrane protein
MLELISNFWGIGVVLAILLFITLKVYKFRNLALADVRENHAKKLLLIKEQQFDTVTEWADSQIDNTRSGEREIEVLKLKYLGVSVLFYFIAVVVCLYLWKFNGLTFGNTADVWGQMGDYFGGMLNPIFAFASFIALLYTIQIQSEELRLTRKELNRAASAATESANLEKQNIQLQSELAKRQESFELYKQNRARLAYYLEQINEKLNIIPNQHFEQAGELIVLPEASLLSFYLSAGEEISSAIRRCENNINVPSYDFLISDLKRLTNFAVGYYDKVKVSEHCNDADLIKSELNLVTELLGSLGGEDASYFLSFANPGME